MKKLKKSKVKSFTRRAAPKTKAEKTPQHRPAIARPPGNPFFKKHADGYAKRKTTLTGRPDIRVKKEVYSKAVRGLVLSNADARQILIDMGGENTIDIIREFDRDMSDEELAKKTGIKASDVRVVLNRLHNQGLFSYTRVRDRDSGWYSYIWKMSEGKLKEFGEKFSAPQQAEAVEAADGEHYVCASCSPNRIVLFEDAVEAKFKCGNCGSSLEFFEKNRPRGPAAP